MKPLFFSQILQDYVVDEMCSCGHLKSQHGSLTARSARGILRQPHDGGCCHGICDCKRFTFVRYVTIEERSLEFGNRRAITV